MTDDGMDSGQSSDHHQYRDSTRIYSKRMTSMTARCASVLEIIDHEDVSTVGRGGSDNRQHTQSTGVPVTSAATNLDTGCVLSIWRSRSGDA